MRLGGGELMGYRTIVGLGMMLGEHQLGVIPCIDGGPPLTDPPGSTSRDMSVSVKLANLLSSAGPALSRVGRHVHGGGNLSCPGKVGRENSAG